MSQPESRPETPPNSHPRTTEFVRLFTAGSRRVYTYLLTLVPQRQDAEEVFQEVSLLLWEKFDEFESGTNFDAWACKIAYFRAMKHREKQQKSPVLLSDEFYEAVSQEALAMADTADEEYRALADCFAKLRAGDQELIQARYAGNGAPQQLAELHNRPIKSIYKALHRIRQTLLECVTRQLADSVSLGGRRP